MSGEIVRVLNVGDARPPRSEPPPEADVAPDPWTREQERAAAAAQHKALKDAQLRSINQDISERKQYADQLFKLVLGWLGIVTMALWGSGWRSGPFRLSDKVLLGLLGGTTVTVVGLFGIVAHYLFPRHDTDEGKAEPSDRGESSTDDPA